MSYRQTIVEIFNKLRQDESLLRLLVYKADNYEDDIQIVTPERPSILSKPPNEIWEIVSERILYNPKPIAVDDEKICRIILYTGGKGRNFSPDIGLDKIIIETFVHTDFQIDFRLESILDRIKHLLSNQKVKITTDGSNKPIGIGNFELVDDRPLHNAVNNYLGFQQVYQFADFRNKK